MSVEHQSIEQPSPTKPSIIKETNLMQVNLIKESGEDPSRWIEKNSAAFREIIESSPYLIELYRQNPEVARDLIKKELEKRQYH